MEGEADGSGYVKQFLQDFAGIWREVFDAGGEGQ